MNPQHLEEFHKYRFAMRSEARSFLEDKKEFLQTQSFSVDYKLLRVSELVDFFILEEEPEIAEELAVLGKVLRVKKMLETKWLETSS